MNFYNTLYFFESPLCWDFIYVVAVSTAEGKVRDFINFYSRSHKVDLSLSRTLLLNKSETIRFNLNWQLTITNCQLPISN